MAEHEHKWSKPRWYERCGSGWWYVVCECGNSHREFEHEVILKFLKDSNEKQTAK